MEQGRMKFFLTEFNKFDSLYNLVSYYRENPVRGKKGLQVYLTGTVPQIQGHENAE